MLSCRGIDVHYGKIHALKGVSLHVEAKEIVAFIGANGAGKTTLLRAIAGMHKPSNGGIEFMGKPIAGMTPADIVRAGISHAPEGRRLFNNMTVLENLELGAYSRNDGRSAQSQDLDRVFGMFPRLKERYRQLASTLSGGEQQMLTIGRALMSSPKLLLLDEPSMGLAPTLVRSIFAIVEQINAQGITILLVEQNAFMALSVAHRAYVLETGRILMEDRGSALLENPDVKKFYLGERSTSRRRRPQLASDPTEHAP